MALRPMPRRGVMVPGFPLRRMHGFAVRPVRRFAMGRMRGFAMGRARGARRQGRAALGAQLRPLVLHARDDRRNIWNGALAQPKNVGRAGPPLRLGTAILLGNGAAQSEDERQHHRNPSHPKTYHRLADCQNTPLFPTTADRRPIRIDVTAEMTVVPRKFCWNRHGLIAVRGRTEPESAAPGRFDADFLKGGLTAGVGAR